MLEPRDRLLNDGDAMLIPEERKKTEKKFPPYACVCVALKVKDSHRSHSWVPWKANNRITWSIEWFSLSIVCCVCAALLHFYFTLFHISTSLSIVRCLRPNEFIHTILAVFTCAAPCNNILFPTTKNSIYSVSVVRFTLMHRATITASVSANATCMLSLCVCVRAIDRMKYN